MTTIIETADAPGNTRTPYAMAAGDEFRGQLDIGGHDWIKVTLLAGSTYSFGAVGLGALNSGVSDPEIILRNVSGVELARDDDGGPGLSAGLTYTAATTGTYFIDIHALTSVTNGSYGLSMTLGNRVSYGVELGAAELYRAGLSWAPAPQTAVTVTWGLRASGPALDASGEDAPFHRLTAAQTTAAKYALENFASVANITFEQVNPGGYTNKATILMGAYTSTTDGAGAFANFPGGKGAANEAGDLWLNTDSVAANRLPLGSYSQFVLLHELGHAMGLDHPGDYNAAPGLEITYENDAQFAEDSAQYSIMSYFDALDTEPAAPHHYAQTLMMYDIYAMQQLYGVNSAANAGASIYGFNTNVGGAFDFANNRAPLVCIWDGAGNDTLDVSGFAQRQRIDLRDGHFSDVGGFKQNVSIALNCDIENAVGGSAADSITGNDLANRLVGRGGADTLIGGAGSDRLVGNNGADVFVFAAGSGKDRVMDFGGADVLSLASSLWGGAVRTAAEVVEDFARLAAGHVVLDFGADEITLMTVSSTSGLSSHILLT